MSCQNRDKSGSHTAPKSRNESVTTEELKAALRKPLLTEEEYEELFSNDESEMSVAQLARVRFSIVIVVHCPKGLTFQGSNYNSVCCCVHVV